jgi:nicotinamidase/pyrazinamidase
VAEGFATTLLADACRGVNLNPGDIENALREMRSAGVTISNTSAILNPVPGHE